jgi:hypothetical protein
LLPTIATASEAITAPAKSGACTTASRSSGSGGWVLTARRKSSVTPDTRMRMRSGDDPANRGVSDECRCHAPNSPTTSTLWPANESSSGTVAAIDSSCKPRWPWYLRKATLSGPSWT